MPTKPNLPSTKDLLDIVLQAVSECGWYSVCLPSKNPYKVKIYKDAESYQLDIIIYNITHGGGTKRSAYERRIQWHVKNYKKEKGYKTLILGYDAKHRVFAGWDASKHISPKESSSLQIHQENLANAATCGFSPYNKGNDEIAIAFKPDFFVEYVRNLESLHTFGENQQDFEILENVTRKEIIPNETDIQLVSKPRQKTLQIISKAQRDNLFREKVMRAYNSRCAFSGIQLKLVDAAHIVPVSEVGSSDDTCNGIALSALHHRAYDRGLITFTENYKIIPNPDKIQQLRDDNLDGNLAEFLAGLRDYIDVPPDMKDRPNPSYIRTANRVRGWNIP
jgi:putative restriction endonuclease